MDTELLNNIVNLRILVGFLGEKNQFNWWSSSFFSSSSGAFLGPIFRRTQLLARCNGVTQAASLIHDEHIGVGHVYHLFRLPEDLEQGLYKLLHNSEFQSVFYVETTKEGVLDKLSDLSDASSVSDYGPVRVGNIANLYSIKKWKNVAGLYKDGFGQVKKTYPYFSDLS